MSGAIAQAITSNNPWLTSQELLAPREFAMRQTRNDLLNQASQQEINATDMEMVSRASAYLDSLPTPEAKAAAWPGVFSTLKSGGFARNMPEGSPYPGDERIKQLAMMGTPSQKLLELSANRAYANATAPPNGLLPPTPGGGGGGGATYAIPSRGTGGPGAQAQLPPEYLQYFREASAETGIPMELLIAQARQESSFDPNAKGRAGEIGMFQIMPSTARDPGYGLTGVDPASVTGPENVRNNILFGARYLKARGGAGDPNSPAWQAAALRGYNAGGDPNYVANVFRYRPGLSPGDPAAGVTTYATGGQPGQPTGGGVAARTGGTDVAGPPGTVPAAPGATTAQTTQPQQPPAQQAPAAPGLLPLNSRNLTPADEQEFAALGQTGQVSPLQLTQQMQQRADHNLTRQHQLAVEQRQAAADAAAAAERDYQHRRNAEEDVRKAQAAELAAKKFEFESANAIVENNKKKAELANITFNQENTLRDEFQTHTKDFRTVQTAFENITEAAAAKSGAGDMSMLYAFLHMIDPQTGIKESEYGGAAAAGSLRERLQGALERITTGGRLTDSLRDQFLHEADKLYRTQLKAHNALADQYETLAKNNGLNPANVVTRFVHPQEPKKPSGNLTTVIP